MSYLSPLPKAIAGYSGGYSRLFRTLAGTNEEGEAWSDEGYEAWSDEGEEVSDDELIERILGLESKSSGKGEMLQFLGPMESDEHLRESVKVDAKRSPRRVPSSLVADICLWPKDAVAHITILHTNGLF